MQISLCYMSRTNRHLLWAMLVNSKHFTIALILLLRIFTYIKCDFYNPYIYDLLSRQNSITNGKYICSVYTCKWKIEILNPCYLILNYKKRVTGGGANAIIWNKKCG